MTDDEDCKPFDIWEERRQQMGWYFARAINSRYSAFALYRLSQKQLQDFAAEASYGGDPQIAIQEAFLREAAISLELISKASLATHIKENSTKSGRTKMPNTHDLFLLFEDLDLKPMTNKQAYFLSRLTETLYWSGRYGAPSKGKPSRSRGKRFDSMMAAATLTGEKLGKLSLHRTPVLEWEDFDNLFNMVLDSIHPSARD